VENSNGRSPETKIESAKLTNGVSDTSKMVAPKPIVVAVHDQVTGSVGVARQQIAF